MIGFNNLQLPNIPLPNNSSGRPKIPFSTANEKTERRRNELLRKFTHVDELVYST